MIFPDNSVAKESACNAGDPVGFLSREDPLEKGIGYPLQYSGLERSMDCVVHGVAKRGTQLRDFHLMQFMYLKFL